jgi:hypothetical protein
MIKKEGVKSTKINQKGIFMNIKKIALSSLLASVIISQVTSCVSEDTLNRLNNRYTNAYYETDEAAQILKLQMLLKDVEQEESMFSGLGYGSLSVLYLGMAGIYTTGAMTFGLYALTQESSAIAGMVATLCALSVYPCFEASIDNIDKETVEYKKEKKLRNLKTLINGRLKSL